MNDPNQPPDDRPPDDRTEEFVRLIALHQRWLYSYALKMLGSRIDADEVFHETTITIWRKFEQYESGTNFQAWARRIAHFQILQYRRKQAQERRFFSDAFVENIALKEEVLSEQLQARRQALSHCLSLLQPRDRDLIQLCYSPDFTMKAVAEQIGCSANAIYKMLGRIRQGLFECINRTIAAEERA